MSEKIKRDTDQQNWEDAWVKTSSFKKESISSKPIFFGAPVVYFFARLINWFVSLFKSKTADSSSAKVSPLINTSTDAMRTASHKIAKPANRAEYKAIPTAEVCNEKFEDEGIVYRP